MLNKFQEVLNQLESNFDSHEFIKKYVEMFPKEYLEKLLPALSKRQDIKGVTDVDAEIARFLSNHSADLKIEKDNDSSASENILGNISSCAKWHKIN